MMPMHHHYLNIRILNVSLFHRTYFIHRKHETLHARNVTPLRWCKNGKQLTLLFKQIFFIFLVVFNQAKPNPKNRDPFNICCAPLGVKIRKGFIVDRFWMFKIYVGGRVTYFFFLPNLYVFQKCCLFAYNNYIGDLFLVGACTIRLSITISNVLCSCVDSTFLLFV